MSLATSITLKPPATPPTGEITLAGSKSFMNRALVLSALANGPSRLVNPSGSDDSRLLRSALESFGVKFQDEDGVLIVTPPGTLPAFSGVIDIGPAGTVARFLTALIASIPGTEVTLQGTEQMHRRPIGGLVDALRSLGASIEYLGSEGSLPLQISGRKLVGGDVEIDGSLSSQFLTALMLVAPSFENGVRLIPKGELVSRSYLRMTLETLGSFGVSGAEEDGGGFAVSPSQVAGTEYLVEGDGSGASYLWGLAAITGGTISVGPFSKSSPQGDIGFVDVLEQMGCSVRWTDSDDAISVTGPPEGKLGGVTVDMEDMPDVAQTLAVLAAVAEGETVITGLQTLKLKETDRLTAPVTELKKLGVAAEADESSLTIRGVNRDEIASASIATYEDHRMAMSFALLGAVSEGITIEEPEVVSKSFPDYWEKLESLGVSTS